MSEPAAQPAAGAPQQDRGTPHAASVPPNRVAALGASAALVTLIALCVAWEWWLAPLRPGGSALVLKAVPLLLALPGVWRQRVYTLQWASMLILLYFTEGVVRGWSDRGLSAGLGWLEVMLSVVFFICALAYVAPFKRAAKRAAKQAANEVANQAGNQAKNKAGNQAANQAASQAVNQAANHATSQPPNPTDPTA